MVRSTTLALATICVLLFSGSIAFATGNEGIRQVSGDWGCSFKTPDGPLGVVGGIIVASIDRNGDVTGTETIATASNSLESLPISGKIEPNADGTFDLEITVADLSPDPTEAACVGMDGRGKFNEFRCIDTTDEGDGDNNSLSFITCKRR